MDMQHLVKMANDIGAFFRSELAPAEAERAVAAHLRRFWDPRMRKQIVAHHHQGGEGLDDPAKGAIALLAEEMQSAPAERAK